jgi:hypothetical protein
MAKLDVQSFTPTAGTAPFLALDMNVLSKRLQKILKDVTGSTMSPIGEFTNPPRGLNASRDRLRMDFANVWKNTTIVYNAPTYGATATHSTNTITFGEFFLKQELPEMHLKKVLLHEFLHLVVDMPRQLHHGQINNIIQFGLRLPGDPNPLGTD